MKSSKLILLAVSAISTVGCSGNKLPMPEGERQPLNQNGIPADLAIAIAREKAKTNLHENKAVPSLKVVLNNNQDGFSHAKNPATATASKTTTGTISNPVTVNNAAGNNIINTPEKKTSAPRNPFTGTGVNQPVNSVVSEKFKTPIKPSPVIVSPLASQTPVSPIKTVASPVTPANAVKPAVSLTPIKIKPVETKSWVAEAGSTLRQVLFKWSGEYKCSGRDWNIVWPFDFDYPIDSRLSFNGTYYESLINLFELYKKAKRPVYLDIYQGQCLIIVSDTAPAKSK